jgi:hypothetical protein
MCTVSIRTVSERCEPEILHLDCTLNVAVLSGLSVYAATLVTSHFDIPVTREVGHPQSKMIKQALVSRTNTLAHFFAPGESGVMVRWSLNTTPRMREQTEICLNTIGR